jgi:hypothetical protein
LRARAAPTSTAMMPTRFSHCEPTRLSSERCSCNLAGAADTVVAAAVPTTGEPAGASIFDTGGTATSRSRKTVGGVSHGEAELTGVACSATWATAPGFDSLRSAATACSSWKTRAVTAASCASRRNVRSSVGDLSEPSLMSSHSTQPHRTEQTEKQRPQGPGVPIRSCRHGRLVSRRLRLVREPSKMKKVEAGCLSDTVAQQLMQLQRPFAYYATVDADPRPAPSAPKNTQVQ